MPANAKPVEVQISQFNCWKEGSNFYVTGICNSQSDQWQKIWLRMEPKDSTGKALYFNGAASVEFPVFSAAIPPRGRSAFFKGWPLKFFSKMPDTCVVSAAGGVIKEAGPVLLVEGLSGVRMLVPVSPGSDSSGNREIGWQISATLSNPLTMKAEEPCIELLIYGTDQKLWFANSINMKDANARNNLQTDDYGPIPAGAKRLISTRLTYGNMPRQIELQKIGKVEVLAFENR